MYTNIQSKKSKQTNKLFLLCMPKSGYFKVLFKVISISIIIMANKLFPIYDDALLINQLYQILNDPDNARNPVLFNKKTIFEPKNICNKCKKPIKPNNDDKKNNNTHDTESDASEASKASEASESIVNFIKTE